MLKNYGGLFDPQKKKSRISKLEEQMKEPNFWDNRKQSEKIINEINYLKEILGNAEDLKNEIISNMDTLKLLKNEYDENMYNLIYDEYKRENDELKQLRITVLLNGPYDKNDAIVEIHSGAGGTEACDWAAMLYRMYARYFEKKSYQVEVIDEQLGEEAGLKSLTMIVRGTNVFGYLKGEKGVHRLVRLSPFDSNNRRHTSFASVNIEPLFDNKEVNIEIKDTDIRIDVYRSSGCGGQGVNTTDSAVRITHIPTKIVVCCQNERSQIQNKEMALKVLKSRLYSLELEKRREEEAKLSNKMDISFGSQIRSYVFHPYTLVKDHRTGYETSQGDKVMDGDLDGFISAYLKMRSKE